MNTILRNGKKKYFEKKFREVERCPKQTWGPIKKVIGLKINSVPDEFISAIGETFKFEMTFVMNSCIIFQILVRI